MIAMIEGRMRPRRKIVLGALGVAVLACALYAGLHALCIIDARWLYR